MFGATKARTQAEFFAEMSAMVNAGMSLGEALTVAGRGRSSSSLGEASSEMGDQVSGGQPLSEVMEGHPQLFSPLDIAAVAVGESTGRMERALRNLADFYERDFELRHLLARELAYPIVLFGAILFIPIVANFIRIWITGSLIAALGATVATLFVYLLTLGVPIALVILVVKGMTGSESGRMRLDRFKINIPLIGPVVSRIALARYCRALASLYSSGVLMGTAMRLAGEAAGNEVVRHDLTAGVSEVERGGTLSGAFEGSSLMPESVLAMVRTGERTGEVDAMADNVADHLEQEARTSIKRLTVSITPIAVLIAGVIVAVMAMSFYLGLYTF